MKKISFHFFFLLFFILPVFGQNKTIDSLKIALKNATHDTSRCNILNMLFDLENEEALLIKYNEKLLDIVEKKLRNKTPLNNFYLKSLADSKNNLGFIYERMGNMQKALEQYSNSLTIQKRIGNKKEIATTLNSIGYIYEHQGDIPQALEYYSQSLKIREEIGNKKEIAVSLNNIGVIYSEQDESIKAIEYFKKSLKIREEVGDKKGIATSLNNIGTHYDRQKNGIKALEYYTKSLKIEEEIGHKEGIATSLNNIGYVYYYYYSDYSNAFKYYEKALKLQNESGDKEGVVVSLTDIGRIFIKQKTYNKALEYNLMGMKLAKDLGFPEIIKSSAKQLNTIYKALGDYKAALENYELYIAMRDSIINNENKKASIKSQLKYEYEKKAAADSVKVMEEKKVVALQFKQEKTQRFALYGGLALVLVFAGFMFNRFRVTQKQKNIIVLKEKETLQQKHIIEEKHKEITDSINYAERIQRSFLATKELLDENLSSLRGGTEGGGGYFVLFKPKDVVSGDFYWSAKLSDGNFALATADSTGHGVPGAIMSLLNVTSLEKAIEHYTNPADILNHTRQTIIERLKKDGSDEGGKDGMDCSLLVFDYANKQLHIAAANNPVWIIRDNKLIEIKPDKMPVGKSDKQDLSFTTHTLELQKGDTIYTLTDGFPDQFGGDKGKKFMSKKLKELLLANVHLPIAQQKELLDSTFKNWVGDLEQVDDVTVIGIKV
jgi:serine phosphatase RsbU (regulator of sigma subunit)/Tfp pilus assembly protein PilF